MMKKIIILSAAFLTAACLNYPNVNACPINTPGECKADISGGLNTNIQERELHDNLKNLTKPTNTMDMRQETTQPQTPSNINTESRPQEQIKGYDANCQFGDCMNNTQDSEISR